MVEAVGGGKTQPFQFQLQLPPLPHWLFFTLCEFCMNPAALKFPSGVAAARSALQIASFIIQSFAERCRSKLK